MIFGAQGFLGKQVSDLFKKESFDVVDITRAVCDLTDHNKLLQMLNRHAPRIIINCAATVNFNSQLSDNKDMQLINVSLVKVLADFSAENDCHLVHVSSVAVYGSKTKLISANTKYNPDTHYAQSKLEADNYITLVSHHYTIMRMSGIYGENGPSHLGLNNAIKQAKQGITPSVQGTGIAKRNYIHVKDAAYAILFVVKNKIFNTHLVAGNEVLSIVEIIKTVCDVYLKGQRPKFIEKTKDGTDQVVVTSKLLPITHTLKYRLKDDL